MDQDLVVWVIRSGLPIAINDPPGGGINFVGLAAIDESAYPDFLKVPIRSRKVSWKPGYIGFQRNVRVFIIGTKANCFNVISTDLYEILDTYRQKG